MPLHNAENDTSAFGHQSSSQIDKEKSLTGRKEYAQVSFYHKSMKNRKELDNMFCLDVFLESPAGKQTQIQETVPETALKYAHPLMCWDVVTLERSQNPRSEAIQELRELAFNHEWVIDISAIQRKDFEVLLVTDSLERISWVSQGFESMTGYSPSEVLNQKPDMLQGPSTNLQTRRKIRAAIERSEGVKATMLNYKKDGSTYRCQIEIIPIYNVSKSLTHFLALEKSI